MYPVKNRDDLEKLNELVSLNNKVYELRLQDKLGKQDFHANIKKIYVPLTNTIEDTSPNISKTITETSIEKKSTTEIKRQTSRNIQ